MKALMSLLVLLFGFLYSDNSTAQTCSLDPPSKLTTTNVTPCSATLHWSPSAGAENYKVQYRIDGAAEWSPSVSIGTDTFYTFLNLTPGTPYQLSVKSFCADGSISERKKRNVTLPACESPFNISVSFPAISEASISFQTNCSFDTVYCRYGTNISQLNMLVATVAEPVLLSGLNPNQAYYFQISTCQLAANVWSDITSFHNSTTKPNILLIVLDDSRFDSYSCNGGPSWFQSINIDRIANEGINFRNSFAVYSYCTPSRGTIMTGLYPHKNGAIDNTSNIHSDLPTLATILNDAGYNTGMMGKYINFEKPQDGFDYWLCAKPDYLDEEYNYNGTHKIIMGHNTDILTDSALLFIEESQQPFFLWLGYHAPHNPATPQLEFDGIYADKTMPVPENTDHYSIDYPSFLDNLSPNSYIKAKKVPPLYQDYFESLAGIDHAVGSLFEKLSSINALDNTMIIFVSDNGHLYGEHGLFTKRVAYEPSIRIPLFIRYPAWFSDSTIVDDQMALNIDIAPTIIEAAGIPDTYGFDGTSLKKLADYSDVRQDFLYEYLGNTYTGAYDEIPFIRAVRSFNYKYIYYGCDGGITEEFFDLINDPGENNNLINDINYDPIIDEYRDRLAELRLQFQDSVTGTLESCYLSSSPTPCPVTTGFAVSGISKSKATVSWNAETEAVKYKVRYKVSGTNTWTNKSTLTNSIQLSGLSANTDYSWEVRTYCQLIPGVTSDWSAKQTFTTFAKLGVAEDEALFEIFPNPVSSSATISFSLEENSYITIELFDLAGRKIQTLFDENSTAGNHQLTFTVRSLSDNHPLLTAGIYFLRLKMNAEVVTRKVVVE